MTNIWRMNLLEVMEFPLIYVHGISTDEIQRKENSWNSGWCFQKSRKHSNVTLHFSSNSIRTSCGRCCVRELLKMTPMHMQTTHTSARARVQQHKQSDKCVLFARLKFGHTDTQCDVMTDTFVWCFSRNVMAFSFVQFKCCALKSTEHRGCSGAKSQETWPTKYKITRLTGATGTWTRNVNYWANQTGCAQRIIHNFWNVCVEFAWSRENIYSL